MWTYKTRCGDHPLVTVAIFLMKEVHGASARGTGHNNAEAICAG